MRVIAINRHVPSTLANNLHDLVQNLRRVALQVDMYA